MQIAIDWVQWQLCRWQIN